MYVLFSTSGSTGQPKKVEIEHRALLNFSVPCSRNPASRIAMSWPSPRCRSPGWNSIFPFWWAPQIVLAEPAAGDGRGLVATGLRSRRGDDTALIAHPANDSAVRVERRARVKIVCGGEALPA